MARRDPSKTSYVAARLDLELMSMLEQLRHAWGPVVPLTVTDVVAESIRRAYAAEKKSGKIRKTVLDSV